MSAKKLSVVGAGAIGLSTAILAQKKGFAVSIYTAENPLKTTSTKAAASFKPTEVAYNALAYKLTQISWRYYEDIARRSGKSAGVFLRTLWEAFSTPREKEGYLSVVKDFVEMKRPDVPGGYALGWRYKTFLIDIPIYIPYLIKRFLKNGGKIIMLKKLFKNLDEVSKLPTEIIFNCTGYGAKALCKDDLVIPIKGQIVTVEKLSLPWSINADGFYIYPRSKDTIIGGTYEWNSESQIVETGASYLILKGNLRIIPDLLKKKVIRSYIGIRPYREKTIRIESEIRKGKKIIHNYGHGGAGITLSWGSADEALDLI